MLDYPQNPVRTGHVEPVPRRIRAFVGATPVLDTTGARYVWEVTYYPQYYIPICDVRMQHLLDEDHPQRLQLGPSRLHSLTTDRRIQTGAARVYDPEGDGPAAGYVRFDWDALEWFEEDEQVIGHPRNPYVRVDALRSHRHVRVEIEGGVLAETRSPVLLFETGLPTRYYVDRTDVSFERLEASNTQSVCPYKGITSRYWSVQTGGTDYPDIAWTYEYPMSQVAPIAGLIGFYNEKLDLFLDGRQLRRPPTHFA